MSEEYCLPVHFEGAVDTTLRPIHGLTKTINAVEVFIHNTHASNILYVSFDGGEHWLRFAADKERTFRGTDKHPVKIVPEEWKVKGSVAGTTYEIVVLKVVEKK